MSVENENKLMVVKLNEGRFAIECDSCHTVYAQGGEDNTASSCEWDAQVKASDLGFISCGRLHICTRCQDNIQSGEISVSFTKKMSDEDIKKEIARLDEVGGNGKVVAKGMKRLNDFYNASKEASDFDSIRFSSAKMRYLFGIDFLD